MICNNNNGMGIRTFFSKIFSPMVYWNLFAMCLVFVGICIGVWIGMEKYTRHGEKIEVPDINGMLLNDAEYALERAGLKAFISDSSYNRNLPAGTILDQFPQKGSLVKSGRSIYLVINARQTPTLPIPDIADNCSLREAEAQLKALGFKIGPIEYVSGDKDWVLAVKCKGQNVYAGERVPIDMPVVLVVGTDEVSMDYDTEGWTGEAQTDSMSAGGVLDF